MLGLSVALGLAVVVVVAGALVIIRLTSLSGPESQFDYPITWRAARLPAPELSDPALIRMNEDGTAHVTEIRLGRLERSEDGRLCTVVLGEPSSGGATWELDGDGVVHVRGEAGEAAFLPDRARFDGADWSEVRQPFCDGTYTDFSGPVRG